MTAFSFIFALAAFSSSTFAAFTSERFALSVAPPTTQAETLSLAQHIVNLTDKAPRSSYKAAALRSLRKTHTAVLEGASGDSEYVTDITIGAQTFKVSVDTGSSDTWLVEKGFKCFGPNGQPGPPAACEFGTKGFDTSKSKTFKKDPNHNFNITYGSGESVTGDIGFDTVTVGGLTVAHQEIGIVTRASFDGVGVTTGLMGLAFSTITTAYRGTDLSKDNLTDPASRQEYSPFIFSAIKQKKVKEPIFSISINRGTLAKEINSTVDKNLGILAFGGIAPVPVTNTSVTVPIQGHSVKGVSDAPILSFYAVNVDTLVFAGSENLTTSFEAIIDSGTTLNRLPTEIAKAYNAAFEPPAKYDADTGLYLVDCNATAPAFSAVIGGVTLTVDPRDNIVGATDGNKTICASGTQDGGPPSPESAFILGDVFLHNVVTTFNLGKNTTTLSQRQAY